MSRIFASSSLRIETIKDSAHSLVRRETEKNWKDRWSDSCRDVYDLGKGIAKSGLKLLQGGLASSPPGVLAQELSRLRDITADFPAYRERQERSRLQALQVAQQVFTQPRQSLRRFWEGSKDYLAKKGVEFLRAPRSKLVETLGELTGDVIPLVLGAGLVSKTKSFNAILPGGRLAAHEGISTLFGGKSHLIQKHVGKGLGEMLQLLETQRSRQISSFRNLKEAEKFVEMALRKAQPKIGQFLSDPLVSSLESKRLVLDIPLGVDTGNILRNGTTRLVPGQGVRLILDRVPNPTKLPYVIFTGFPVK